MQQCSGKMWNCITDFFTYETTKSVVVKSWTIGIINRVVQLLIITYFIGWVFLYEKAYQVRDTAIESSVMTKGASVFCVITKLITTENQVQGHCPESELKFKCDSDSTCKKLMLKPSSNGWCPAEIDEIQPNPMMEVENFTIFIKNSIRFPRFNFTKGNFLPNINSTYIKKCNFDFESNMYCPIFKVGDVIRFAQQDFTTLAKKSISLSFSQGGVIGIKIAWVCDLDKADDECKPAYSFTRLDAMSEKTTVSPGYNFRYAKYFKMENGTEYRTLLKAYAIRFDVLVNGDAGKFDMIPTLINMVAAFTSVGVGTVLCDIILLNFLKGADQYKAKKFEEVSDSHIQSNNSFYRTRDQSQHSIKTDEKFSNDSGAFSIGQYS
ncbi:P2X purinoceptor 3 [Labeo rohita]|uniref:P2X purinoceptor n=1 Tax=Labeo rohita TaxID=84645 RepID=A0ABQ8N1I5_LABRO|nr:P2X purinoceptor 3 [Labeo rohita]